MRYLLLPIIWSFFVYQQAWDPSNIDNIHRYNKTLHKNAEWNNNHNPCTNIKKHVFASTNASSPLVFGHHKEQHLDVKKQTSK